MSHTTAGVAKSKTVRIIVHWGIILTNDDCLPIKH